jgi:hypothetical protein
VSKRAKYHVQLLLSTGILRNKNIEEEDGKKEFLQ